MSITDAKTEAGAAAEIIRQYANTPIDHGDDVLGVVLRDGQRIETIDREHLRDQPKTKRGKIEVHTPDALVAYAKRHLDDDGSTLWADVDAASITVILNDHDLDRKPNLDGHAGWADHRVHLQLRHSAEWAAWTAGNEKLVDQETFAAFLEEHVQDVAEPDGVTLLEVARTFHATVGARFKRATNLNSGETQLVYEQQIEAAAGRAGDAKVPTELTVALRPFYGDEMVLVRGRFMFRVRDGQLALGYRLLNLIEVKQTSVQRLVGVVSSELALPIIEGAAPGARR